MRALIPLLKAAQIKPFSDPSALISRISRFRRRDQSCTYAVLSCGREGSGSDVYRVLLNRERETQNHTKLPHTGDPRLKLRRSTSVSQNSIDSVIFDFGGVLLRWRPEEIIREFYADELLRDALRSAVFQHPDWIEMDRGTLSEVVAAERFAARMGRPPEEIRKLLEHVRNSLTPIDESFAIANTLAGRGIRLYALSNMPASTFAYLRNRYGCWDVFKGIVISGEVGMIKPEPGIFNYIARRYGLVAARTVFVDDQLPNIESGSRLGFRTIQFSNPQQCAGAIDALLGEGRTRYPQG